MQVTVKAKHLTLTEALKDYAKKKLLHLQKYFDHLLSADVMLETERNFHLVEVTIHANGATFRGEERSGDMYSSIDMVVDKLERQIHKHKEKIKDHHRGDGNGKLLPPAPETPERRIVAKRHKVPLITPEEAAQEMEERDYSFYLFCNQETENVNLIYRQENGNLAVLEPVR